MDRRSQASRVVGTTTLSAIVGALLIAVGAGAPSVHGLAFGLALAGAGLAWSATAWGMSSKRAWAAPAAAVLGSVTAIVAALFLLLDAVAILASGGAMRQDLPVAGALSGWTSLLLVGFIGAAGVSVTMATKPAGARRRLIGQDLPSDS